MIRAFVALLPPAEIRSRLTVLQFMLPMPRRVEPADLHLTLAFLGEVPDAVLADLDEGLARLRMAPFAIEASGVGLFGGAQPRAAWAGVAPSEPLDRLQSKVAHMARQAGAVLEARRFVPHVTLGRFAPPGPEDRLKLEAAVVAEARFRAGPWPVEEVALVRSWGPGEGPRYQVLASYPLA